ncbi:MAG: hypothetical protein ACWGNV_12345 [Bacteroidales bacterium]
MKTTITRTFHTALLFISAAFILPLQAQSQEQIEQFNKEREAFFNEKLELTPAEQKAFWPIYNDFYNRKMKMSEDERNTFNYSFKNAENLSDEEINSNLKKIQDLKEQQVQLENEYYQNKFPKVLPPKKVLKLYGVEWDFRRHLLRKLREQGQQGNNPQGGRNRNNPPPPLSFNPDCPL